MRTTGYTRSESVKEAVATLEDAVAIIESLSAENANDVWVLAVLEAARANVQRERDRLSVLSKQMLQFHHLLLPPTG